jgi:hypothetical protein
MFAIPIVAVLFIFIYLRPHEIFEWARFLTVNLVTGLAFLGVILDMRVGAARPRWSPLLMLTFALFGWCLLTTAIKAPDRVTEHMTLLAISAIGFLALSQGIQSLRALEAAAAMLLALTLLLAFIGVYQGYTSTVCFAINAETTPMGVVDVNEGRPCVLPGDCREGGLPDREYWCEHPGLLGTHSYAGRVRFRGLLEDPNELAWAIAMGTPLAFALLERKRTWLRLLALLAMLGVGGTAVVLAQSRSGQIAMVAMLGVYFIRRFGWKGALAGAVVALPLLMLGGRSGEEADSSAEERRQCWGEALTMWRENPFTGVGGGQFLEHYAQTAHNSFMLTLAEMGPLGLMLFTGVIYAGFKITLRMQSVYAGRKDAAAARTWATAFLSSLVGLVSSAFFLTLAYHAILWIYVGLVGALYAAVRAHDPEFRVRFGLKDLAYIAVGDAVMVVGVMIYLRMMGIK